MPRSRRPSSEERVCRGGLGGREVQLQHAGCASGLGQDRRHDPVHFSTTTDACLAMNGPTPHAGLEVARVAESSDTRRLGIESRAWLVLSPPDG